MKSIIQKNPWGFITDIPHTHTTPKPMEIPTGIHTTMESLLVWEWALAWLHFTVISLFNIAICSVQHSDLQWMCCDIFGGWSATHTHRRNLVGPQRADHRQRWRSVVEHRSFQRERPTWAAWCQRTRWSHRDLAAPTSVCQRPAAIRQRPEASARTCRGHVRLPSAAASAETGGVAVSLPTEHLLLLFLCPSAQMETLAIDQPHLLVLSLTRTTQFHMSTLPNRNRQQKHAI